MAQRQVASVERARWERARWQRARSERVARPFGGAVAAVLLAGVAVGCGSLPGGPLATPSTSTAAASAGPASAATGPSASLTGPSSATTGSPAGPATAAAGADPPAGSTCRARGTGSFVLPDPHCTPGALNPAVTPATTATTICVRGWTATVRPPESYTEPLKLSQMQAYGDTGSTRDYEEDHLVPLELGGAPADPRNLWPEPGGSPHAKDTVESAARRAVCDGSLPLVAAQAAMAADWVSLGERLGVLAGY